VSVAPVSADEIAAGLRALGCHDGLAVVVHSSLRSFGTVIGGAAAVCDALVRTCGTILMPASSGDRCGIPAPPGLVRPDNAAIIAESWESFTAALERAQPFDCGLPIDRELGVIPETLRQRCAPQRSVHPLFSMIARGQHAAELLAAQRLDWPLGPLDALEARDGAVLLLGVDHTSTTAIHLAEQRLERARFFRYAVHAPGIWGEYPNLPGDSHRFDAIAAHLAPYTREQRIGACRARLIPLRAILDVATALIRADPATLLCTDPACRCTAAAAQRRAALARRDP